MKFRVFRVCLLICIGLAAPASVTAQNLLTWFSIKTVSNPSLPNLLGRENSSLNSLTGSPSTLNKFGNLKIAGSLNLVSSTTVGQNGETALAVYAGTLTISLPGGKTLEIKQGQATILNGNDFESSTVESMSTLMQQPAYREMLLDAVRTAASDLAVNTNAGRSGDLTRALAAVVQVVSEADPTAARSIVETAVGELTKGGKNDGGTIRAVSTVVAAAVNGSQTDQSTLIGYAATAASANGSSGVTESALSSPINQFTLGEVFDEESIVTPIDITVVSPSS